MEQLTLACTKTAGATAPAVSGSWTARSTLGSTPTTACALPSPCPDAPPSPSPSPSPLARRQGWGTFKYAGGNVYTGVFCEGMQHGRGTLVYADGRREDGEFKNDKFLVPAAVMMGES